MFRKQGHKGQPLAPKTFKEHLGAFGRFGLTIGILGLTGVSALTTYEGLQSFLEGELSLLGAFSLHAVMFGLEVNSIHGNGRWARRLSKIGLLVVITISITFSYVGLSRIFISRVVEARNPIQYLDNLGAAQAGLQQQAADIKVSAISHLEAEKSHNHEEFALAQENYQARGRRATELRERLRSAHGDDEIGRLRRLLTIAEADTNSLRPVIINLIYQGRAIEEKLRLISDYTPSFMSAEDWDALQQEYQALCSVFALMPEGFKSGHKLPEPPRKPVLQDGKIPEGKDHPIIEAIAAIKNPAGRDVFCLFVAVMFDLVPFLALLGTRDESRGIPERLYAIRRTMNDIDEQVVQMPPIIPWAFRTASRVFFSRNRLNQTGTDAQEAGDAQLDVPQEEKLEASPPTGIEMQGLRQRPTTNGKLKSQPRKRDPFLSDEPERIHATPKTHPMQRNGKAQKTDREDA